MDTPISPLNILVVEDNENFRESIVDALENLGHHVRATECAESLPEQHDLLRLDIAVLDLNLPGEDGLSLAERLRATHPDLGIIMLTARSQSEERSLGYARGADIYLTKPGSLSELENAIGALARRLKRPTVSASVEALTLDCARLELLSPNGPSHTLTNNEASLLAAFARSAQNILENWQIAEILGMNTHSINKSALELHIVRLRKKLPVHTGSPSAIQVIRGRGYQLCIPIRLQG